MKTATSPHLIVIVSCLINKMWSTLYGGQDGVSSRPRLLRRFLLLTILDIYIHLFVMPFAASPWTHSDKLYHWLPITSCCRGMNNKQAQSVSQLGCEEPAENEIEIHRTTVFCPHTYWLSCATTDVAMTKPWLISLPCPLCSWWHCWAQYQMSKLVAK